MNKSKLLLIWAAAALVWVAAIGWWQWDNITLKPWTLDWTFSFWGYGPAKTQTRGVELLVVPPLLLLALGWLWLRFGERKA